MDEELRGMKRNTQGKFVGCQGKLGWCCNTDAADETDRADGTDRAARLLWVTGVVIMSVEAVHGFIGGSILLLDNVTSRWCCFFSMSLLNSTYCGCLFGLLDHSVKLLGGGLVKSGGRVGRSGGESRGGQKKEAKKITLMKTFKLL